MIAVRLFAKLGIYYALLALALVLLFWLCPAVADYLPIGRVQALLTQTGTGGAIPRAPAGMRVAHVDTFGGSMMWLVSAMAGAMLTSLPVSWVYMQVRDPEQYDQSLIGTIVMLPIVVTSIVVIVQHSLALSFSLAGIAGAARFRNSLKSSGDLLFTLLAVAIGLSAGIGAMELALVTSVAFNLCFLMLWVTEYGERYGMKRYLHDFDPNDAESTGTTTTTAVAAMAVVTETVTEAGRPDASPLPEGSGGSSPTGRS